MDAEARVKILVCYYQPWELPKESIYFPIQAGKVISGFNLGIQGDDTGDNISSKNATFSEFTAWYWGWKNIKNLYPNVEYIGLSHYRRFFALDVQDESSSIIDKNRAPSMENYVPLIKQLLNNRDIILAKPAFCEFNVKTQYEQGHYISDYYCLKNIIHDIYPEYDESFLYFFENNSTISRYCMFIARYDLFTKYFEWLFPLLFEAERRIDTSKYDSYQKRVLAFLGERLLNVYVYHNKLNVIYKPIYYITNQESVPYIKIIGKRLRKILKFLTPYGIIKLYENRRIKDSKNKERT